MTQIITVANHKGGVGKTATTQNLGAGLALKGFRVLLIDLDAQANLSLSFGLINPEKTIYEALRGEIELPIYRIKDNLDIVPSCLDLSAIEVELLAEAGRDYFLRNLINKIKSNYDYILIDCPPSIGVLTINSLATSNKVLIPMVAHFLAVQGIQKLFNVMNLVKERLNPDLALLGVLVTKFDGRTVLQRDIKEAIENEESNKAFKTAIRENTTIAEATYKGVDVFEYDPSSNGAIDYSKFITEVLDILL